MKNPDEAGLMPPMEELICAALRGERPCWPAEANDSFAAFFLSRSAYHGVQALLHQRFHAEAGFFETAWPNTILDACKDSAIGQAMWEMRHQQLLRQVVATLTNSGVRPIFFKGTALAYDLYSSPHLRTRGDTDIIIPLDAREKVGAALESLGFTCWFGAKGDLVSHTAICSREDAATGVHELDLHWRISNAQILSRLFSYEELRVAAAPLPALSADAIAAGRVHALLLACMHRAGHRQCPYFVDDVEHYGGDRLIWLYDIHLILGELSSAQYEELVAIAERKGLGGVCLEGVEEARACFHTSVPEGVRSALARMGPAEAVSRYLDGSVMYQYYANFLAVDGAANKVRFLGQLLFPSEEYMRRTYPRVKPDWLPWLYARRTAIEIAKRIYRTLSRERREAAHDSGRGQAGSPPRQ